MKGSPAGDQCKQDLLIEGPGLNGYILGEGYVENKWARSVTNACLDLDKDYPLRVYTTPDLTYNKKIPIDGVVRNFVFSEIATDTTIVSPCTDIEPSTTVAPEPPVRTTTTTVAPEPPAATTTEAPEPECGCYALNEEISIENDKCVLDLSTISDVKGNWSFAFDLKINSLPTEPSDPPYNSGIDWYAWIVTGIGFQTTM